MPEAIDHNRTLRPRYVSIVLDAGRYWSDHAVIDLDRGVRLATCSREGDADLIAKVLNLQHQEREAKALLPDIP